MNATTIVAYAFNGALHCTDCAESRGIDKMIGTLPVFAGEESDCIPTCDICQERIEGTGLTTDGIIYELQQRNLEVFYVDEPADAFLDEQTGEYLGDGWYSWYSLPGCIPDSDAFGPYDTEIDAYMDRESDLW